MRLWPKYRGPKCHICGRPDDEHTTTPVPLCWGMVYLLCPVEAKP